jgi:hypothetical protein
MATGPYYLATPLLTSYHQQFWVIAQIVTENKDGTLAFILIHFPELIDIIFFPITTNRRKFRKKISREHCNGRNH